MSGFLSSLVNKVENTLGSGMSGVIQQQLHAFLQPDMLEKIQTKADECGLGDKVRSWIGHGENLPVTPDEIREILGSSTLHDLVERTGLPADTVLNTISKFLPDAVNTVTPDGVVPDKTETDKA